MKCRFCAAKTENSDGICSFCRQKFNEVHKLIVACENFKKSIDYEKLLEERRNRQQKQSAIIADVLQNAEIGQNFTPLKNILSELEIKSLAEFLAHGIETKGRFENDRK